MGGSGGRGKAWFLAWFVRIAARLARSGWMLLGAFYLHVVVRDILPGMLALERPGMLRCSMRRMPSAMVRRVRDALEGCNLGHRF